MPRLPLHRNRTTSETSSASDRCAYPALPSPRAAILSERSSGCDSPYSPPCRKPSPTRSDKSQRVQPSASDTCEGSAVYVHPYANPALLSTSERNSLIDPFGSREASPQRDQHRIVRNDSSSTIAASEETVVLSHSISTNLTSTSMSMANSSTSTSTFSVTSASSSISSSRSPLGSIETDADKYHRRVRRETKLGPISAPSKLTRSEFSVSSPYNLISLEEAQALAKERNRVASGNKSRLMEDTPPFSASAVEHNFGAGHGGEWATAARARTVSAGAYPKHSILKGDMNSHIEDTSIDIRAPSGHSAEKSSALPSPVGSGKTLKPKRSGFLKMFNGRERDKPLVITHPLPNVNVDLHSLRGQGPVTIFKRPSSPAAPTTASHRVPVPTLSPTLVDGTNDVRPDCKQESKGANSFAKKPVPVLSIKISAPLTSMGPHVAVGDGTTVQESRRSDSPKISSPQHLLPPLPPASAPPGTTQFAALSLRPVSAFFSESFADHLMQKGSPTLTSPTTLATDSSSSSPLTGTFGNQSSLSSNIRAKLVERSYSEGVDVSREGDHTFMITALQDQLRESRKAWQRQIWELEGQVRDLKVELEELRSGGTCEACGRGVVQRKQELIAGVVHRARAKTGTGARFASGNDIGRS